MVKCYEFIFSRSVRVEKLNDGLIQICLPWRKTYKHEIILIIFVVNFELKYTVKSLITISILQNYKKNVPLIGERIIMRVFKFKLAMIMDKIEWIIYEEMPLSVDAFNSSGCHNATVDVCYARPWYATIQYKNSVLSSQKNWLNLSNTMLL